MKIRKLGLAEVSTILQRNIDGIADCNSDQATFTRRMNHVVMNLIESYNTEGGNNIYRISYIKRNFIHEDDLDLLPIPVLSNTNPENTIHFLIHIILSMGQYKTEMDALCHASFRDCLREVKLIGTATENVLLQQ